MKETTTNPPPTRPAPPPPRMPPKPGSCAMQSSGNKYHRIILGVDGRECIVDVYAVLVAFGVTCPARQHAIKKLLCSGIRGKGSTLQDLRETVDAVERAITLLRDESDSVKA